MTTVAKRGIYTYTAPWTIYGMNWSVREEHKFRLAVGSFVEEYKNKVEIIQLDREGTGEFNRLASFDHPYPTTKIMWSPSTSQGSEDLLGTTGDYLRIWKVGSDNNVRMKCLLNPNKHSEFCAPLTSFDWNETDPTLIGTSSIDTTCTIWNVETQQPKTQLIAHDKEVYDIAFATKSTDIFGSVGADGSVRMFDLRALEHSTIVYETNPASHLLRLSWNKQDTNYLTTFALDSATTVILDIRVPSHPVAELQAHEKALNAVTFAPHSSCHVCTGGDDGQALIWDLSQMPRPIQGPILAYNAEDCINNLQWSTRQPDWIGITFGNKLQILRV